MGPQARCVLRLIESGKLVQNASVESFHWWLRDECLDRHWFLGLADARHTIEAWRKDYNRAAPQCAWVSAPGGVSTGLRRDHPAAAGVGRTLTISGSQSGGRSLRRQPFRCASGPSSVRTRLDRSAPRQRRQPSAIP
jgi:hypothetical protein